MQLQFNPYVPPLLLSVLLSTMLALLAWRRRPSPGAATMAVLMAALAAWSAAYALELASADLTSKVFWAKMQYLAFLAVPALWFVFVLQYTGRQHWLRHRAIWLLAVVPLVTLVLVWTTEAHGLIYSATSLDTRRPYTLLHMEFGAAYYLQGIYAYLLFFLATMLVFQTYLTSPPLQRSQLGALLLAALAPLIGNLIYVMGLGPVHLDLAPFALTITGVLAVWALFRYRFLEILPVARDALIEGMSDGVIVLDAQDRVIDLNGAAQRMLGRSLMQAVGHHLAELIPDWPHVQAQLQQTNTVHVELALNGQETQRYVDIHVTALREPRSDFSGLLLVLRDISARKRVEQAEREQRAMAEALREAASAMAATLGLDEVLDLILTEAVAVVSHDSSTIMLIEDGTARIVCAHGYVERGLADWATSLRLSVQETFNLRYMSETGQPLAVSDTHADRNWVRIPAVDWIRSYAGAPIVVQGEVIGFLNLDSATPGFFSLEHAERLQAFANQAGIAIFNARLYSSLQATNEQLEAALRAREEIIQNVSHELRTPLTLLLGYIELMETTQLGPLTADQVDALRLMRQQGQRLRLMVNSLLALQTFRREKLVRQTLDLETWLLETVEIWQHRAQEAGAVLSVEVTPGLRPLMASPNYLELVLGTLIDNAIKFSPHGGAISVHAWQNGDEAMIQVTDQGVGIPPEQLGKIFERFYQVDGTATRRFGGMGIGLALSRSIIDAHGGRIWAESVGQGQGSSFLIALPSKPGQSPSEE